MEVVWGVNWALCLKPQTRKQRMQIRGGKFNKGEITYLGTFGIDHSQEGGHMTVEGMHMDFTKPKKQMVLRGGPPRGLRRWDT